MKEEFSCESGHFFLVGEQLNTVKTIEYSELEPRIQRQIGAAAFRRYTIIVGMSWITWILHTGN